jgi:hypothetical protein
VKPDLIAIFLHKNQRIIKELYVSYLYYLVLNLKHFGQFPHEKRAGRDAFGRKVKPSEKNPRCHFTIFVQSNRLASNNHGSGDLLVPLRRT